MAHPVRRAGQILTGLTALLALLALLFGAPVALALLGGNPLPDTMPSWTQISDALTRPDDSGALFIAAVTIVGWIAWVAFVVPVIVEVVSRIRGIRTPRLPALSGMQSIAAGLVASVSLLIASPAVAVASSTPAQASPATAHTTTITALASPATTTVTTATTAPTTAASHHAGADTGAPATYRVHKGDNLSAISQRVLGDDTRYTEIADLNPRLIHDPDLIHPGQRFVLPDGAHDHGARRHATGHVTEATEAATPPASTPAPQPADTDPAPAATTPATAAPTQAAPAPAASHESSGTSTPTRPTNPTAAASAAPAPAPTADADDTSSDDDLVVPVAATVGSLGVLAALTLLALRRRRARQQQHRRPRRRIARPVDGSAEAKLHVAAVSTDWNRLDAALRTLAAGLADRPDEQWPDVVAAWVDDEAIHLVLTKECPAPPPPWTSDSPTIWTLPAQAELPDASDHLAPLPSLVTVGSQPGQHLLIDLERLGMVTVTGDPARALDLVRYIGGELAHNRWSDEVNVVLAGLDPDEAAWMAKLDSHRITVADSIEQAVAKLRRRLADTRDALAATGAATTMVGRGTETGEAWPPQVLLIANPAAEHQELLTELEQELIAAPSSGYAVVVTGAEQPPGRWPLTVDADGQLRVAFLTDAALTASALPPAMLQPLADLLDTAENTDDQPTPPAADTEAWAEGTDAAGGLYEPAAEQDVDDVAGGMDDMFGPADDGEDEQDSTDSEPVTAAEPVPVRPASAVTWNLANTETTPRPLRPAPVSTDPATMERRRRERDERDPHLDADLAAWTSGDAARPRISVLGPVQIVGAGQEPKERQRFYAEFIVYLASRGAKGSTAAQLEDAIWRDQTASSRSRRSAISHARTWLGETPDGGLWMPRMAGSQPYHLVEGYLFDWSLFRRLRARGEARGTDGADDLRAALELVRGAPFAGVQDGYHTQRTPYAWLPDSDVAPMHLVAAIVDTAHELVELYLAAGDLPGAHWAVERAWLADPERHEGQPWRDAMRLAHAEGRDSELAALIADLMRHRDAEHEEDLDVATYQLVRRLTFPSTLAS
ncbi:LysM domain-containing protein [Krasilnikovia cinnamomea]|uniref:LysM domain-containing protein n=1 Tax=Krasilnikovia cinnamomea TaxID=349313 RepID=A0A4Q7Z9T6_9ACTN|nr:LysM peptidoglycan-binding domain-containing protein [Krasilnikovia cinnamomea]RZU46633.1 LysM domain-containing protein [Krasilnikovia cinnamomea]